MAALQAGADGLAVATAEEAVQLRDQGYSGLILVMGPLFGADQVVEMAAQGVDVAVVSEDQARMLAGVATERPLRVHLKVDTGMNRQGVAPSFVPEFLELAGRNPGMQFVGVMTHFAAAPEDPSSVEFQMKRFRPAVEHVRAVYPGVTAHAANSAASLCHPASHLDMVRCGIAVYGLSPFGGDAAAEGLRPALTWTSVVALVRSVAAGEGVGYGLTWRPSVDTRVALVALGYADGVFRALANRGAVLIGAHRYPMVGRVSMDSFAVDVGPHPSVLPGDRVTLIGRDGEAHISAEEVAGMAGTINYEITCSISLGRAERTFIN
jgi:alanine racemase